jgi:hypothetical protein
MNNQQHLLNMTPDESIDILPAGIASNPLLSTLETTLREKSNIKKQNKAKEDNDRLNRSIFFLKNITTSMTYNGDQFNAEIKLSVEGRYVESSMYTPYEGKMH